MIQFDGGQYRAYVVSLSTRTTCSTVRAGSTRAQTLALTEPFPAALRENDLGDVATVHAGGAPWLPAVCHRHELRLRHEALGNNNAVKYIY